MNIGSIIRMKREEAGLTQQQLGDMLFVSRQTVSRWEGGSRNPDLLTLRKIASILNISNDEVLMSAESGAINYTSCSRRIFAGFDCGGSNTRCMLVSEEGKVLGVGRGGPSNYSFCGKITAAESIRQSVREAFSNAGLAPSQIEGMFIASAAVEVFCGDEHQEFFKEVTGCKNVVCNSDIFPVWYAGSRFEPAAAMIAGTGSVSYLLNGNNFIKASGWGPQFGDEGSGYDIGRNAIKLVSRMADKRIPMDNEFFDSIMEHFGVTSDDYTKLLDAVNHQDHRKEAASAARVVMRLCDEGNPIAASIVNDAAEELALDIKTLCDQSEDPISLLISGGLLQNDTPVRREFVKLISNIEKIKSIVALNCDPVYASAAIALCKAGLCDAVESLMNSIEGVQEL